MDPALHAKILKLLDEHRIMSLATLRPDGWPQCTTVGYVSEGLTLYFMCGRQSQKAANLARDNRVSLTIDHDTPSPMSIEGLSMATHATPVSDPVLVKRILSDLLPRKYPEYGPMMAEADMSGIAVYQVSPEFISVLDYSKGFAHTDLVDARPDPFGREGELRA